MQKVLLYYKYVEINNAQELVNAQKSLCKELGIKGRILIGKEGINGTVAGTEESIDKYIEETIKIPEFTDIEWKVSMEEVCPFPRLRIVVRDEIVTLGLIKNGKDADIKNKAPYIEPEELLELYENNEDFTIIDARNEYEARIGKFKDAKYFDIESFRELPEKMKELETLKEKPVVLYCTGGVRCEKLSAHFIEEGFKDVKHLHGGIHMYSEKAGGKYFDGEMYVFDKRVSTKVNHVNPTVISECHHCDTKIARFINCHNSNCNTRIICCEDCGEKHENTCSDKCLNEIKENPELRAYKKVDVTECGCM